MNLFLFKFTNNLLIYKIFDILNKIQKKIFYLIIKVMHKYLIFLDFNEIINNNIFYDILFFINLNIILNIIKGNLKICPINFATIFTNVLNTSIIK